MSETTSETALLKLPYIMPSQAQKHVTHNEALRALDALIHLRVEDRGCETPPADPAEGQRHALGPAPTGAFSGQGGRIAAFQDGAWAFHQPREGWVVWDAAAAALIVFHDGDWTPVFDLQNVSLVGINTTADATNRLAVASDATLLTHVGAGHQLKVNKAAAGNTASLLFQSGWSGRAEMGLAGNDDFSVKVSPNGSAWTTALRVRASDGNIGIGAEPSSLRLSVVGPDGTIGSRATSNTNWCGMNLYRHDGAAAASFQYGNPGAGAFANEFVFSTRQSDIPIKFYQGSVGAGNERLRIDASGRIALLNAAVGVGTATPHTSAQMEIAGTARGLLPPRVTTAQRDAIASPAEGLMVYNTTVHAPQFWNGSAWVSMG